LGLISTIILSIAVGPSPTPGRDAPVITISRHNLAPQRIEVHVGERVVWRAAGGERLRLKLDAHSAAHEVIVRTGEVHAVFLEPGEHWYAGAVVQNGHRDFRGVVNVLGGRSERPPWPVCGPGSSHLICVEP
jgi:hypothetical protein